MREIEIWFTEREGHIYVLAEHETSNWVQNLRADAEVRVRIGSESFAARARVLRPDEDGGLCREIQELSRRKYGWGNGLVVQLTRKGRR